MIEYISPTYSLQIGSRSVRTLESVDVYASIERPIEIASVMLDADRVTTREINTEESVHIALGYREKQLWPLFSGRVRDISAGRNVKVSCRSTIATLITKKITQALVDVGPSEVAQFALDYAGVPEYQVVANGPRKHTFVIPGLSVLDALKLTQRTWSLDDWIMYAEANGAIFWGPWEQSPRAAGIAARFEYGKNIINLRPTEAGAGTLETILLPFVRPGNLILITDERFWGKTVTARVEHVHYHFGEKARLILEWRQNTR